MTKRMLIDASHPEETRVVVLDGNRIEDFDLETENRRPLKGNIYLARIVRVEPSLQAAFVEYGGNRHGFLAFGEIHPDYYQIPVADRQRLIEAQAREAEEDDDPEGEIETAAERLAPEDDADLAPEGEIVPESDAELAPAGHAEPAPPAPGESLDESGAPNSGAPDLAPPAADPEAAPPSDVEAPPTMSPPGETGGGEDGAPAPAPRAQPMTMHVDRVSEGDPVAAEGDGEREGAVETVIENAPPPETVGGGARDEEAEEGGDEERRERRISSRFLRHYKIQEVIRRRQVILVQVVKEERGNKGAALTSYISLPGRFSVLMPNSPKGGGVSRKISSAADRKRLREVIDEVGLPRGMGIIVRTAGAQRPKPEIRRDCEYLLRLWDDIRTRTLASTAPTLVYEEADLLKRSIRDNFAKDIEEITIEGEDAFRQARDFTRMLMPQNERKVKLYREPGMPLFARAGVEAQLDAMMSPRVELRSGGTIVINQTEALVSIDVNSGRATRDRHIEDTALRTNLEAADEIARQLRLRDLAGLIVIDFIDMESSRNDAMVERRMKEALQHDRARIQVGRISHFGLLEMSRQRLRPSLTETSFVTCAHCQGLGIVRSDESAALHVLRAIEEEGARRRAAEIVVHCSPAVALQILNRKRERLGAVEARHAMCVVFSPDATMTAAQNRIERTRPQLATGPAAAVQAPARMDYAPEPVVLADVGDDEEEAALGAGEPRAEAAAAMPEAAEGAAETGERRRRRRRRRGGRREDGAGPEAGAAGEGAAGEGAGEDDVTGEEDEAAPAAGMAAEPLPEGAGREPRPEGDARRRRGRRGGSRFRRDGEAPRGEGDEAPAAAEAPPGYTGPTPADPFGGLNDALLDAMDAVEVEEGPLVPREIPVAAAPLRSDLPLEGMAPQSERLAPLTRGVPDEVPAEPLAEPASAPAPAAEAAPEAASRAEPVAGAAVQPVVLGAEEAAAPAKKGWWRR